MADTPCPRCGGKEHNVYRVPCKVRRWKMGDRVRARVGDTSRTGTVEREWHRSGGEVQVAWDNGQSKPCRSGWLTAMEVDDG